MTPLADEHRMRIQLRRRNPVAWTAVALAALSFTGVLVGCLQMSQEERSSVLLAVAAVLGQLAWTLAAQVRSGSRRPDWLRFGTQSLFWLTLVMGLVVVANGSLPFLGQTLETSPSQNVATDLGNALLGGLIVAAVLIVVELAQRRRDEEANAARQLESERSAMLLLLGIERNLARVDLSERDLSWFSLRNRNLSEARLRRSCLFRANLEGCTLEGSELNDADLTNAFMAGASLTGAHLHRAVLDHAHLQDTDLSSSELFGSSMRSALLARADLTGADLRSVDLRGADLQASILTGARYDHDTFLPEGVDPAAAGMTLDLSTPRGDLMVPTGRTICGADHDDDRAEWARQQKRAAEQHRQALIARRTAT